MPAASSEMSFTSNAANQVKKLMAEEGREDLKLRVVITGGGCSGFQYGFSFEENVNDGDLIVETEGVSLVVDPMSIQYLEGSTVDYIHNLEGARFIIDNQNATTNSGCGSSLSV